MKKILLFLFFFAGTYNLHAQYWLRFGGGQTIDEGLAITTDDSDNIYTTGFYTTAAQFGTSSILSAGLDDIFIVKTDSFGSVAWLKTAGGIDIDKALSIAADHFGNIVITGYFYSTAQFDAQSITSAGQQDIFVAKYNSSGTLLWVVKAGGTGSDIGNDIAFDNAGNVIVTGEFAGICTFDTATLTSLNNSIDVFTAKYDSNGNLLWVKQGSGKFTDRGTDVGTDSLGNIYVSGMFGDTITFDNVHNNTMVNAMFVIKYDSSGQEQWFRWIGTGATVLIAGISVHGNDVNVAGNFYGTLYFLGDIVSPTLSGSHPNNIFVCRYDLQGNFIWSHSDGSESDVDVKSIATKPNGEVVICGDFKCRFTDYSNQYGTGIFCSIGYSDCYAASYDTAGVWLWARNYGSKQDDYANGIATFSDGRVTTTGSYQDIFCSTSNPNNFIGYETSPGVFGGGNYCLDNKYAYYVTKPSNGNSDVYINSNFDLSRQPFDYFHRSGSQCVRPFRDLCVSIDYVNCKDSFFFCNPSNIYSSTNTYDPIGPMYFYLWSTGSQFSFINVAASGTYNVQVTTQDGCFLMQDTFVVVIDTANLKPTISDSKGVNIDSAFPSDIYLCYPDTVELLCTNVGSSTVHWNGFPVGMNPITVYTPGTYSVTLQNSTGCNSATSVKVILDYPLPSIIPELICLEDLDGNDSITICKGDPFTMLPYDSITNPLGNLNCIPGLNVVNWTTTNINYLSSYAITSFCPNPVGQFFPSNVGDFDYFITAAIIRANGCDTDTVIVSRLIHVHINPAGGGNINITVTGPTTMCYGDTIMLIATGGTNYFWNTGETTDTIYVTQPGSYFVNCSYTITNSFGCPETYAGYGTIYITIVQQPNVTIFPIDGVICPGDSVLLVSSGFGNFAWQGPNGTIAINNDSIYVYTPGFYFCVVEVDSGCSLVSNTVAVILNSLPTMITYPGYSLCDYDTITLQIVTDVSSIIAWLPPLSGNSLVQQVYAPGTYSCNVTSCGVTTLLTSTITHGFTLPSSQALTICNGDSVAVGNHFYSQTGIYSDTLLSFHGCDSVVETNLNVIPSSVIIFNTTICDGDSILFGSNYFSVAGNYSDTLTSVNGCDSINSLNLSVTPPSIFNQQFSICNGDSVQVLNHYYSVAGTYADSLNTVSGCDSIIITILQVGSIINFNQQLSVCNGDSILVGNNFYSVPGTYVDTINIISGCDSVLTTTLSVNVAPVINQQLSVCTGDSVQVGNNFYSVQGIYHDTLSTLQGCDSIVITDLTIQQPIISNQQSNLCYGDSILFAGNFIYASGIYSDTLSSSADCDSIIVLTVISGQQLSITITGDSVLCENETTTLFANGGTTYVWSPSTGLNITTGNSVICSAILTTLYTVVATDANGCSASNEILVSVENSPDVSFTYTVQHIDCKNEVSFSNTSSGAIIYNWNFGDSVYSSDVNPVHDFAGGNFVVQLTGFNSAGCSDTVSDTIVLNDSGIFIFIPNIFTPNGDGSNDIFTVKINCIDEMHTSIFNQWGKLLFESDDLPPVWNGQFSEGNVPDGVYFYLITTKDSNGVENSYKGTVTLLR